MITNEFYHEITSAFYIAPTRNITETFIDKSLEFLWNTGF